MKVLVLLSLAWSAVASALPPRGLIVDLDAARGVVCDDQGRVLCWQNQREGVRAKHFVARDEGRSEPKSGCPTRRLDVPELGGKPTLRFRQQELVCLDEDDFDELTQGKGHTWIAILAAHPQRVGLKNVNSFFGNLRNGGKFEGFWGCLNDDNTLWWGVRNGHTFGRFDENNPQLLGPRLATGTFYLVAGRMAAGGGTVSLELFVDEAKAVVSKQVPVNPSANPSRLAIGQERDAVEHPGHESFDGEIARFLIWNRPLSDEEWNQARLELRQCYWPEPKR